VTWMLFWMRRQAAGVSGELRAAVDRVLSGGGAWGLAVLAFSAVIREGIETALFLVGQATAAGQGTDHGALSVFTGATAGLVVAVGIGYGFYRGSRGLDLAVFFRWTGLLLIFIAGGLLSRAAHEFVEIGLIPIGTQIAYDLGGLLPDTDGIGSFLRAIMGYSAAPEVTTLTVYVAYLAVVIAFYLRPVRRAPNGAPVSDRPDQVEVIETAGS
jgi:high-affinity iron transporter